MGVNYRAMIFVGKHFDSAHEAEDFLRDNIGFTDEEEREIEEDGLQEFLCCVNRFSLDGEVINCYSDYGFLLGTELGVSQPEMFGKHYSEAVEHWNKMFPEHPAQLIREVKVY